MDNNKMVGWIITLSVLAGLGIAGGISWSKLMKEHHEARNVPLDGVDFNNLRDGTYQGSYAGGRYHWRVNECQVKVTAGQVTDIQLAKSKDPAAKNMDHKTLYDRVIEAQSLQVDSITSATLTSKAYLKAVENALVQAQQV